MKTKTRPPIGVHGVRGRFSRWVGVLPLVIFLLWVVTFGNRLSPWALGWTQVFGLLYSVKWYAWWGMRDAIGKTTLFRTVGYLLLWPGMDARAFLNLDANPPQPTVTEWTKAVLKTGLGVVLIWVLARRLPPEQPILVGAVGTVGFIFLFLFGGFHIVALLWQQGGVDAPHIMNRPGVATSLGEFWGARWNLACHRLSSDLVFRRVVRRFGHPKAAMLASFLVSGLLHDLVISFSVKGGYGLPTIYFMIQGVGLLIEHSRFGRRLGLRRGVRGWTFTLIFTAGPVFCLFHRPFMLRGMLPFLHAIGAL